MMPVKTSRCALYATTSPPGARTRAALLHARAYVLHHARERAQAACAHVGCRGRGAELHCAMSWLYLQSSKAQALKARGVEVVAANFDDDAATLSRAFQGAA